jgi:hypothetical protein
MNLADPSGLIGALVSFILTLLVFSYILGDNPLFRLAIHLFIGVAAGYVAVVAWYSTILPKLVRPLLTGGPEERLLALIPFILSGMLLAKASQRWPGIGSPAMAYLVGVGAAAVVGGAILGTLFPQVSASVNLFDRQAIQNSGKSLGWELFNASILLLGALATLAYFHFGVRTQGSLPAGKPVWLQVISYIGLVFIAITFGVLFAGVYAAALSALIERLDSLINFIFSFFLSAT